MHVSSSLLLFGLQGKEAPLCGGSEEAGGEAAAQQSRAGRHNEGSAALEQTARTEGTL